MIKIVLASVFLLSVNSIHAAESIRWDSVSLSYQSADIEDFETTGYGIYGSKLISNDFFIEGNYSSVSGKYVDYYLAAVSSDFNTLVVGLGYRYDIFSKTDLFGVISYKNIEKELYLHDRPFGLNGSESGITLKAGIRSLASENIELRGSISYTDIADESDTGFNVSAMYHFTSLLSAGIGYGKSDDTNILSISTILFF